MTESSDTVLLIKQDRLGLGDDELGHILMLSFLNTIREKDEPPAAICLLNSGVKLCLDNSRTGDALSELQSSGVRLLVCGTCLDYYGLKNRFAMCPPSNMHEITDRLLSADKVICL